MLSVLIIAAALQTPGDTAPQHLAPVSCTAEPNFVTRERYVFQGDSFRFSGTVTAGELDARDFAPFASFSLLEQARPEELSAVLSVQSATERRFDVTLRRLINNELRARSIIGRVPSGQGVPFELVVRPDRTATFRLGNVVERVELDALRPDAVVLACSSGSFRFDNLVFVNNGPA